MSRKYKKRFIIDTFHRNFCPVNHTMNTVKVLIAITFVFVGTAEIVRYDNYKVYSVIPHTNEHLQVLKKLSKDCRNECDFWTDIAFVGHPVDIMVSPKVFVEFNDMIKVQKLFAKVKIEDVQKEIDREITVLKAGENKSLDWTNYYELEKVCICF